MPLDIAAALSGRLRPPLAIVLGSPREAADLAALAGGEETACYQMDLYQADRLRENLAERKLEALVLTGSDLWSLPANFQTVVYQAPERGERQLKLDMIEQAFHLLRPHGSIIVLSPYEIDAFFPTILKKIFGKFQAPAVGNGMMFLAQRDGDRPRRRHEVHFHGRFGDGPSFRFLSRPGVFSFGRFDNGARALVETMVVEPGNHVLDLGCGCGTNGICAARLAGPEGQITFVDSNLRAIELADHNARTNGVEKFQAIASTRAEGLALGSFDVALCNPPYYGQTSIAQLFIDRSAVLLKPGGRFYLVTKQPDTVGPLVAEAFGVTEPVHRRGYTVLCAEKG